VALLLKILLVPLLIVGVTLGARRWGPRIGGWLNGLPVVAGPVLYFLGIEQGAPFMARAAEATLAGLVAVAAFALVYAWTALRRPLVPGGPEEARGIRRLRRTRPRLYWGPESTSHAGGRR